MTNCGLPAAWAERQAWSVLDADFQCGQRFLRVWLAWKLDQQRPRMLHYVGVTTQDFRSPEADHAAPGASAEATALQALAQELRAQCQDLGPGFQRITFERGSVSLTLCLGGLEAVLGEHIFQADTLFAIAPDNKWTAQLLARRCKRGASFSLATTNRSSAPVAPDTHVAELLRGAGFQVDGAASSSTAWRGQFNPQWEIPNSRNPARHEAPLPGRCAVIGAGLSGASVAHALALRGWQVSVFDQEVGPASGASGLPAGLAVPHVSADDNARSRLTRHGIRLLTQHAVRLLQSGQDWAPSGVLEQCADGTARWHPHAVWAKPLRLVQAWLARTGVSFIGSTQISNLHRAHGLWSCSDVLGREFGPFEVVVVANAMGCSALLKNPGALVGNHPASGSEFDLREKLSALQPIHGTLSHGTYAEAIPDLPDTPVNGNGCFIPHVPDRAGEQWFAGSTFESNALDVADTWAQHAYNMEKLQYLLPGVGQTLAETLDRGQVSHWSATRCVTHDRLPLVGPVGTDLDAGLWLCVGMGSRGLSFSALCAELLVARLCAEPLPLEFRLARSLDTNRMRRKRHEESTPVSSGG